MANWSEIRESVRGITKKNSTLLPDSLLQTWEPRVRQALLNDLLINRQILTADIVITSNPFDPTPGFDVQEIIEITYTDGAHQVRVEPTSRAQVTQYIGESGNPRFWNMSGRLVRIAPFTNNQALKVMYRTGYFELSGPGDTNYATENHLNVVINALCFHAFTYFRDYDAALFHGGVYDSEVNSINDRMREITAPEALQMQGASSWV